MADSQTITPEEREREQALNRARREAEDVRRTTENVSTAAQVAGGALEVGSAAVQGASKLTKLTSRAGEAAGRGMVSGGETMMRTAGGLMSTGVGAIAGVPMGIAGGAVAGLGGVTAGASKLTGAVSQGVETGAQTARATGRTVRQTGSEAKRLGATLPSPMRVPGAGEPGVGRGIQGPQTTLAGASGAAASVTQKMAQVPGGAFVAGAAEKSADLMGDVVELVGTSITIVGLLYAIPKLHYRLIWGNLFHGQYLPAKPLAAPAFWAFVAVLLDIILLSIVLFVAFILYVITNPCEVFVNAVIPDFFSFLKPTMQQLCPDKLLQNVVP